MARTECRVPYTSRFIDNNFVRAGTTKSVDRNSARNHLNTGTFGFRLNPLRPLTLTLTADGTIGRDNHPETPVSPANFHTIKARADYRTRKLRLTFSYRQLYNLNDPLSVYSPSTGVLVVGRQLDYYASHSRDYSATTSFEANTHLSFDVSYSKAHLDTLANLWAELVPPSSTTITSVSVRGYISQYISNLHTVSLIARIKVSRSSL